MRLIDAERFDFFEYEENGTFTDGVMMVLEAIDNAPTIEPNLVINPDEVERGGVVEIGDNIVVMHHDDYYDMLLKSAAIDDGSWERFAAEPCEDAISREDAIQAFTNYFAKGNEEHWNAIAKYVFADIPSVAPSRPSGEWITEEKGSIYGATADRKTEPKTETHDKHTETHECVSDEPQITMSCYGCKRKPMGAEICDDPCHCHYEPKTDCAWK